MELVEKRINKNTTLRYLDEDNESRFISGYGVVFNSESKLIYENGKFFYEIIQPDAIDEECLNRSDIYFLVDHNKERGILGRYKNGTGSLTVQVDQTGLYFETDLPNTDLGDEVLEGLKRGDVSQCSFAFKIADDEYYRDSQGRLIHNIKKIYSINDISVVYNPAYDDTYVTASRSIKEFEESEMIETDSELEMYFERKLLEI